VTATYERTFVVKVPVERAWNAFADQQQRDAWAGVNTRMQDPGSLDSFEPGETKIGPFELHKRMSWSQYNFGLDGWFDMSVTFEEVETGTRITIVRSGFGESEAWQHFAESTNHGWDEMICDLVLYLETGVAGARHLSFRSGIAATTTETGAGLEITHVVPGGFAGEAGMRAGDTLISMNTVAIFGISEVAVIVREHAPGTEVPVEFVREGEVHRGRARLSPWNFGTGEYIGHPGGYPKPALSSAMAKGM
jgi:hypothetical protein